MLCSSCATTGSETSEPPPAPEVRIVTQTKLVDTACDWVKPIFVSKGDVLSDETAAAILAHNQTGAKNCGWKPKSK